MSNLNTVEKLDLLTAHADAWRNLDVASPEKVDILVGWSAPIAVLCNVMAFSKDSRQPGHRPRRMNDDGAEVITPPESRLDLVLRVPSALRRIEAAYWVLPLPEDPMPEDAGQVCIGASQDLLIYLRYAIFRLGAIFFRWKRNRSCVCVGVYPFGTFNS